MSSQRFLALLVIFVLGLSTAFASYKGEIVQTNSAGAAPAPSTRLGSWPQGVSNLFANQRFAFGSSWNLNPNCFVDSTCPGTTFTVQQYENAFQKYLLPHDIYWFSVAEYDDANTSSTCRGSLCPNQEFNNIFSAADALNMHVFLYFPAWGFTSPTVAWQGEVANYWNTKAGCLSNACEEVDSTGGVVQLLRFDYLNIWKKQLQRDIYELYKDYGTHPSFAGLIQYGEFRDFTMAGYGNSFAGFSNQTIANFTRSIDYVNVTKFQPYYEYDNFAGGASNSWLGSTAGMSGTTNARAMGGSTYSFYGNYSSGSTNPVLLSWTPKGGVSWEIQSLSNETLWVYPNTNNTAISKVTVLINFQQGNNPAATKVYQFSPSVTWKTWNRISVDWWKQYFKVKGIPYSYDNMTSMQVKLNQTIGNSAKKLISSLLVDNAYHFQADWLGRNVNTRLKYYDMNNFEGLAGAPWLSKVANPVKPPLDYTSGGSFADYKAEMSTRVIAQVGSYIQTLFPHAGIFGQCCTSVQAGNGEPVGPINNTSIFTYAQPFVTSGVAINYGQLSGFVRPAGYLPSAGDAFSGQEINGWRCGNDGKGGKATDYSCNNNTFNTIQAIPFELTSWTPNFPGPVAWIQSSEAPFVSNKTGTPDVPLNYTHATLGQDYLFNQRYFARVLNNMNFLGLQRGAMPKPIANVLYVDHGLNDGVGAGTNFILPTLLESLGFNVTQTVVEKVKNYNLNQFKAIIWSALAHPDESNYTTTNDIINAVNNSGVGLIVVGNGYSEWGGSGGISGNGGCGFDSVSTSNGLCPLIQLNDLFAPSIGFVGRGAIVTPQTASWKFNFVSSVAQKIFSPYASLSVSDFERSTTTGQHYPASALSTFTARGGTFLINDSQNNPVMTELTTAGAANGRVLWIGTSDWSSGYGSWVGSGLYTRAMTVYLNALLYACKLDSLIPYVWFDSPQPSFYPGVTLGMIGRNDGGEIAWFSDYAPASVGGTPSVNTNWHFSAAGLGLGSSWIALNLDTMALVNKGSGTDVYLPVTLANETWAPVFISNYVPSTFSLIYSNSRLLTSTIGSSVASYVLDGPYLSSSWLTINENQAPSSVTASNTGGIPRYPSLSALDQAVNSAYMAVNQYHWQTPTAWYYDTTNGLLYVHFIGGSPVTISVTNAGVTTSTTTSTSAQVSTTGTTSQSSSSSTSSSTTTSSSMTTTTYSSTSTTVQSAFDFNLASTPSSDTVIQGGYTTASVSVNLVSGTPQTVLLLASGLPPGASVAFSPLSSAPSFVSLMRIGTSQNTPTGVYAILVTGSSGQVSKSTIFALNINAPPVPSYTLTLSSSPLSGGTTNPPPGSYAFVSGSSVTVGAVPYSGWTFSGWLANGGYAGNGTSITLVMNAETSLQALFAIGQPQPVIQSVSFTTMAPPISLIVDGRSYLLPVSFNWPVGSAHHVTAQQTIADGNQTRKVFSGWSGSVNARSNSFELVVSGNTGVVASYKTQYLEQLQFTDNHGKTVLPQGVALIGPAGITQVPANNSVWLEADANYQLASAVWVGANVISAQGSETTLSAARPGVITIALPIYNDSFKVTDVAGLPIQGALVNLTMGSGTHLADYTNSNGTAVFNQVPEGTFFGTISFLGVSTPISSSSSGEHNYTVVLLLSYPLISLIFVFAFITAVFVARRRPRNSVGDYA